MFCDLFLRKLFQNKCGIMRNTLSVWWRFLFSRTLSNFHWGTSTSFALQNADEAQQLLLHLYESLKSFRLEALPEKSKSMNFCLPFDKTKNWNRCIFSKMFTTTLLKMMHFLEMSNEEEFLDFYNPKIWTRCHGKEKLSFANMLLWGWSGRLKIEIWLRRKRNKIVNLLSCIIKYLQTLKYRRSHHTIKDVNALKMKDMKEAFYLKVTRLEIPAP